MRDADDIWALRDLGCEAVVTGKALYEKHAQAGPGHPRVRRDLAKRLMPCLDVDAGRVVKGTQFQELRDAGDPVEMAARYDGEGADELVFLDITATLEGRQATLDVIVQHRRAGVHPAHGRRRRARRRRRPRAAARRRRQGRAEQPAVREPALLQRCADRFGTQCMVIAIDAKRRDGEGWEVFVDAGNTPTGMRRDRVGGRSRPRYRGAGEVLLTSMDRDGTGEGYDLDLLRAIDDEVRRAGGRERRGRTTSTTSPRRSPTGAPTRCSRRAGCTSVSSRAPDQGLPDARATGGAAVTNPTARPSTSTRWPTTTAVSSRSSRRTPTSGEVLMIAWANREALERTLAEGRMVYWSRSRQELWRKGDTSGHVQHWEAIRVDCDADTIVARCTRRAPPATRASASCFFRGSLVPGRRSKTRGPC